MGSHSNFLVKFIVLKSCGTLIFCRAAARIPKNEEVPSDRAPQAPRIVGYGEEVFPSLQGRCLRKGWCPFPEFVLILDLKMSTSTSSASYALFFCSSATYCTSKNTASGITKLAATCTQTEEGAKTSLLESIAF